jgi:peptidoglycan/xylan/chitin deacetylase (PgdA/CDA1 family)
VKLIFFSIKTKGFHNFSRRLITVFTRFGFSEAQTRRALNTCIDTLHQYDASPTFFIPATVLARHPALLTDIAKRGAEIGIHGYVHNDYRALTHTQQHEQTKKAISVFQKIRMPFQGFRNPYLGWTAESVEVFTELGFTYDSNDAVIHDVIDLEQLTPILRSGYEKSLELFQAIECSAYTLRPYFAGKLLRIPTSIPDDEMLFDRLRITSAEALGHIWSQIMQRVYNLGGIYTLNLHPERAVLCRQALDILLAFARYQPLRTWVASLRDIAQWWKERSQFTLTITSQAPGCWQVEAQCTPRATLLARHVVLEDQPATPWFGGDLQVRSRHFMVKAAQCPCIGISAQTPQEVDAFLREQGYPFMRCSPHDADTYAYYLDLPEGLGTTREEQIRRKSRVVQCIEELEAPLIYFGCWPNGSRAAISITGDIDSVTIQDFFLRIMEVQQYK